MIDIHTHILPFVDDGSIDNNLSLDMLKECVHQGITDIVLTPHYRKIYKLPPNILQSEFEKFNKAVLDACIPINLYLGQEIFIDEFYKQTFISNKVLTINRSKHVLIEFDYESDVDMTEIVYELIVLGYIPIIAHYERYLNSDIKTAFEIKSLGGFIQINADSIVGKNKRHYLRFIKKLFKNDFLYYSVYHLQQSPLNHF